MAFYEGHVLPLLVDWAMRQERLRESDRPVASPHKPLSDPQFEALNDRRTANLLSEVHRVKAMLL